MAGKYDLKSTITLSGHVEEVDFNSNIGLAIWVIKLKISSNNSKRISLNTKHEFDGSFVADKACSEVAQEFIPAVQKLIKEIVSHRDFTMLL